MEQGHRGGVDDPGPARRAADERPIRDGEHLHPTSDPVAWGLFAAWFVPGVKPAPSAVISTERGRTVGAGGSLLDPHATSLVLQRLRAPVAPDVLAQLSDQERLVLALVGEGMTNREIGVRMSLAEKTVRNYVSNVLAKLGLQRRTQVVVLATELRHAVLQA
jgi:DNA-binding CsgD family transcriptional regulator